MVSCTPMHLVRLRRPAAHPRVAGACLDPSRNGRRHRRAAHLGPPQCQPDMASLLLESAEVPCPLRRAPGDGAHVEGRAGRVPPSIARPLLLRSPEQATGRRSRSGSGRPPGHRRHRSAAKRAITGAALTSRNDGPPDRPSLTPSHSKAPVSSRPVPLQNSRMVSDLGFHEISYAAW